MSLKLLPKILSNSITKPTFILGEKLFHLKNPSYVEWKSFVGVGYIPLKKVKI